MVHSTPRRNTTPAGVVAVCDSPERSLQFTITFRWETLECVAQPDAVGAIVNVRVKAQAMAGAVEGIGRKEAGAGEVGGDFIETAAT